MRHRRPRQRAQYRDLAEHRLSLVGLGCCGGLRSTIGRSSMCNRTTMFWLPPVSGLGRR